MPDPTRSTVDAVATFMGGADTELLSSEQKGFICSVRMLENEMREATFSGEQVKASVAELFPPAVLFGPEIATLPCAHRELRKWLDGHGANLQQHSSHRVVMTLATSLYVDTEDRVAATQLASDLIAAGRRLSGGGAAPLPSSSGQRDEAPSTTNDRLAHNIAMRFRDGSCKFSGNLVEAWMEYVAEYQQVARDYDLNQMQRFQYMHNILSGDAKRYYLDKVQGYATSFTQAVDMISTEYNSIVRQNRVKNYLSSYRMSSLTRDGVSEAAALEQTYKTITKLAPQVPRSHQGDAHKVEFLRNAVVGSPWATEPLSRIATHGLTFQQLYGELEAALHLHKEARLAVAHANSSSSRPLTTQDVPGILFSGQGRYARPVTNSSAFTNKRPGGVYRAGRGNPLAIMGCFNCDDPAHTMKDCPHPINAVRAAERKLDYYAKKKTGKPAASAILFQLCSQVDAMEIAGENTSASDDAGTTHDANADDERRLFEALMSTSAGGDGSDAAVVDTEAKADFVMED
ncbi:hypothetical protein MMPV_008156 [Pyropia vietnamensis]